MNAADKLIAFLHSAIVLQINTPQTITSCNVKKF